jgi:type IV secretory pathway VirB9-like protein
VPDEQPSVKVYDYVPGGNYLAEVVPGQMLDIQLEQGEVLHKAVGGDRTPVEGQSATPWLLTETVHGTGALQIPHVLVSVTPDGRSMGLLLTTSKRSYYVTCQRVSKSPVRVLRWRYEEPPPVVVTQRPKTLWPDPGLTQRFHVGYTLETRGDPEWVPQWIGDDGTKVFIVLPPASRFAWSPVVRGLAGPGPFLVNSTQYKNVIVIDQLLPRGELRLGTDREKERPAEVVTFARGPLRTITCPGDAACPPWPPVSGRVP